MNSSDRLWFSPPIAQCAVQTGNFSDSTLLQGNLNESLQALISFIF
jgi:hypothetical protein